MRRLAATIAVLLLASCGADEKSEIVREDSTASIPISATAPTTAQPTSAPRPITEAATTTAQAERVIGQLQITTPPPPPSAEEICNSITYYWGDPGPAMFCYRVTAPTFGWSTERIEDNAEFVERVMKTESNHCWNSLGGQTASYHLEPCTETTMGKRDDAGFGQITDILRTKQGTLCGVHGICTKEQTIATPYISMWSFVHVMTEQGKGPWCYYDNGRPNLHIRNGDCATWPG